eukprot:1156204-Pelagomonas_calceolata.AAC.3
MPPEDSASCRFSSLNPPWHGSCGEWAATLPPPTCHRGVESAAGRGPHASAPAQVWIPPLVRFGPAHVQHEMQTRKPSLPGTSQQQPVQGHPFSYTLSLTPTHLWVKLGTCSLQHARGMDHRSGMIKVQTPANQEKNKKHAHLGRRKLSKCSLQHAGGLEHSTGMTRMQAPVAYSPHLRQRPRNDPFTYEGAQYRQEKEPSTSTWQLSPYSCLPALSWAPAACSV